MNGDFIAGLEGLPKNWQRKAEKVPIKEKTKSGIYDFTCPRSELPTLVIITENNEVFRITEQGLIECVFKRL